LNIDAIKVLAEKIYIPIEEATKIASTSKLHQANDDFDTFSVAKRQADHEKQAQTTEKETREHRKKSTAANKKSESKKDVNAMNLN